MDEPWMNLCLHQYLRGFVVYSFKSKRVFEGRFGAKSGKKVTKTAIILKFGMVLVGVRDFWIVRQLDR